MSSCAPISTPPCELLTWDSNFFEFPIGRVLGDTLNEAKAAAVEEWSQVQQIRALYFLARSDNPDSVLCAEKRGFSLADVRVTLERRLSEPSEGRESEPISGHRIRQAQAEDVPSLQAIAATSHRDTRFFNDTNFPALKAEALYSTWIALECQGRANTVLVATSCQDKPLGYISCHIDAVSGAAQIGLVGVSQVARGNGVGKALVLSSLDWFARQGAAGVAVVTQGRNTAAQRLYQRCEFVTSDVQFWFHKWYSKSPDYEA